MNIAIILSGGTGLRVGGEVPKQYIKVSNRSVLSYSLETLSVSNYIDAIWIVAAEDYHEILLDEIVYFDINKKFKGFSLPGETRQLSIMNALRDVLTMADETDYVLIHDAARPMLSSGTIAGCFVAIEGHDGVMPALPMKDTVYLSEDGKVISSLLEREKVFAGQAPELFIYGKYLEANEILIKNDILKDIKGSTETAILAGMDIAVIPGDESNFKITTTEDLLRFEDIIKRLRK